MSLSDCRDLRRYVLMLLLFESSARAALRPLLGKGASLIQMRSAV